MKYIRTGLLSLVVALLPAALLAAQSRPAGSKFQDCADCPEMVVVPAGRFLMGSTRAEADLLGRPANKYMVWERPQHEVTIANLLAFAVTPITRRHYARFAAAVGEAIAGVEWQSPGIQQGDDDPVVKITWGQAQAYAEWLSRKSGQSYRLPSEAEFEYAARAGTTTKYWWGDDVGVNRAVCDGCGSSWDAVRTAPVGSFGANPFGLTDVIGNVFHWTLDCWNPDYEQAPVDGSAWLTGDCEQHVIRGGSWNLDPRYIRAATRGRDAIDYSGKMVGFRVVRSAGADSAAALPTAPPTVLITGANRGIGFEFAKQYAALGWRVIATSRDVKAPALVALAAGNRNLSIESLDVTDFRQIDALATKYRGQPIDVLINNAGIKTAYRTPKPEMFGSIDYQLADRFLHVNAIAPLKISEAFYDNLKAGRQKKIIAITSAVSLHGRAYANMQGGYWYKTSKAALNTLMANLAVDTKADGIIVALFSPGAVRVEDTVDLDYPGMVEPSVSIGGMIKIISELTSADSGSIIRYNGERLPF
jgi:formylglycine-generating enzyme required for sulfatase activity/NAD(P)-dependent dehydrogenase (short-subunit alcohol dehydrogenase family)